MKPSIQFLGGAGTVTGSKFLLETANTRILVDCGLFQGLKELRLQNWAPFPVDPGTIDAVILTHAHLDHTGYLPLLVRNGFSGKIYCTPPTRELTKIILADSAKIQEEDAEYANRAGYSKHSPARPLYTSAEVKAALSLVVPIPKDKWLRVSDQIKFRFSLSGHILGSVFVEMDIESMRLVFSGDLGRSRPLLLAPPSAIRRADHVVVECTYGNRLHGPQSAQRVLEQVINATAARRGHVIIPSFAVGRTQDLLYLIGKLKAQGRIPDLPVFLDSPMGIDATEVFLGYPDWHNLGPREIKMLSQTAIMVRSPQQSAEVTKSRQSCIVIAGSGMVSGGRVLHHLEKRLPDPRNTVLLVGYQAAGTRGRLLEDGIGELKMHGFYVPVRATVATLSSLSAHADQAEILHWLKNFRKEPRNTFLVHGEPQAADALRVKIRDELNWTSCVPKPLERFPL